MGLYLGSGVPPILLLMRAIYRSIAGGLMEKETSDTPPEESTFLFPVGGVYHKVKYKLIEAGKYAIYEEVPITPAT